jgi:hypothetical protein
VAQQLVGASDVVGIFQHWARIAGATDINEFIQSGGGNVMQSVMPDQMVQEQAQAGNLVPMNQIPGAV